MLAELTLGRAISVGGRHSTGGGFGVPVDANWARTAKSFDICVYFCDFERGNVIYTTRTFIEYKRVVLG